MLSNDRFFLARQINNNKNYIIILHYIIRVTFFLVFAWLLSLLLFFILFMLKMGTIQQCSVWCIDSMHHSNGKTIDDGVEKIATNEHGQSGREKMVQTKRVMDLAQAYSLRKLTVKYIYCIYVYVIWFARVRQCYLPIIYCWLNLTSLNHKNESSRSWGHFKRPFLIMSNYPTFRVAQTYVSKKSDFTFITSWHDGFLSSPNKLFVQKFIDDRNLERNLTNKFGVINTRIQFVCKFDLPCATLNFRHELIRFFSSGTPLFAHFHLKPVENLPKKREQQQYQRQQLIKRTLFH